MDYSPPGFSVHGILQARTREWVAVSFFRGSSQHRDRTQVSCIAGRFFTIWVTRKAHINHFQKGNNERKLLSFVQLFSSVWLFVTSWTAACQASLSFTISRSLHKLMSIELMMPSYHLILCHPLLLLPSIFPTSRVFSNEWHQVAKVLELQFQHQSLQLIFRVDFH